LLFEKSVLERDSQSRVELMAATDKDVVKRVREERNALLVERDRLYRLALAIDARGKKVDQRLNDCVAAARLFDVRLALPDWTKVLKASLEEEMNKLMAAGHVWERPELHIANDDEEFLKAILEETVENDDDESRPSDMPSIRDIVLDRLAAAGDAGSKASAIREYIETTYAAQIHVKTVGMTLYRLVKDELARRDGRIWFRVSTTDDVPTVQSGDKSDQNKGSDTEATEPPN
jgi:hypothetical protein